jgi:CheY-like chemotaxis protein
MILDLTGGRKRKIGIENCKPIPDSIFDGLARDAEMNGFEATQYIHKTMKSNPIIALTADVTTVDIFKTKEFQDGRLYFKPLMKTIY